MFNVYLIKDILGNTYVGSTKDLKRRIKEHKLGKTTSTRKLKDFVLYYYEAYSTEELSRTRESKLKAYGSAYHGLLRRIGLK